MASRGSLMFLLHAHLPYVNHPQDSSFLEESWFFEAVVETYVPLISVLERLAGEGIRPGVAVSISPTLGAMLENEALEAKLGLYVESRLELLGRELERAKDDPALLRTVQLYHELYSEAAGLLHKYSGDLITPLKALQHAGQIEILTTSATHAVLPLLARPEAVRAQLAVAAEDYTDRFNCKPAGFWLPECAYEPRLNSYLKLSGFGYTFAESHAVESAAAQAPNGVYSPYRTSNGLGLFARDAASSREVWSSRFGYPGDPAYREFYRDLGYDGDYEYVRPYLGSDGIRRPLGLKYHRITDSGADLSAKQYYDPDAALARVEAHAADFLERRLKQTDDFYAARGARPLIVSCYDAELFGHWWFEGPQFLDVLFRKLQWDQDTVTPITPSEYLARHPTNQVATPCTSSWGYRGYAEVWLNGANDWVWRHLHVLGERMVELARRHPEAEGLRRRALTQAARELLLAQASDWPFIVKTGTTTAYAVRRITEHVTRFNALYDALAAGKLSEPWLKELEERDNLFPDLDYRVYLR
ncbi:MAG TPA: DUF1957 domain-containing protein [Elusimicrobia bacterium]|nr:DUF1957 domain-containing protein [Elusimicrobiota bacterium]